MPESARVCGEKVKDGFTASFRQCPSGRRDARPLRVPPAPVANPRSVLRHRPATAVVLVLTVAFLAIPVAQAQQDRRGNGGGGNEGRGQQQGGGRGNDGLSDSIRRIERSTRSQVLSAERIQSDGRDINRIKAVDGSGRVRIYTDDPRAREPRGRTRDDDD